MKRDFGKILHVNLTDRKICNVDEDPKTFKQFIGGSGYGVYFLCQRHAYLNGALDPESPLLFMAGPLTGSPVPTSGRHTIVARSPLTGLWGESSVGGHWGRELRRAGYDGVIVEGKSETPVYVWVSPDGVQVRDATHVWGSTTDVAEEILKKETDAKACVSTIGPAGENIVPIAGIFTDGIHCRAAARCGLGAVAGSKGLKAIVVRGKGRTPVLRPDKLKSSIKKVIGSYMRATRGLSSVGTAGLVIPCEEIGTMPLRNWRQGSWPDAVQGLGAFVLKERFTKDQFRCAGCPIGCGRVIELDGKKIGGPEYETIALFGGSCMIDSLEAVCRLNWLCNQMGVDTIDGANLIAFAMEMYERGIISEADTGGLQLTWGNWEAAMNLIRQISHRKGFGALLGQGLKKVSEELGGIALECAIHVKGMAAPAHDPRAFNSLAVGYATSNRGACHLQAFSHIFERNVSMKEWGLDEPLDRFEVQRKGELVARSQDLMAIFDSLALCKFSIFGGITPFILREWLNLVTGWDLDTVEFNKCGERIFNLKRLYNVRLGVSRKDDKLPERLLTHKRKDGGTPRNLPPLHIMLSDYYEFRGWDEEGIPGYEKLEELSLEGFRDMVSSSATGLRKPIDSLRP